MLKKFKKIIILAPHIDDGELGCGGTITKFIKEKKEVFYVAFSSVEKSIPKGFSKDIRKKEIENAVKILGLPPQNLILFNYEIRCFSDYRQKILDDMIKINKNIKPDLVILPSTYDTHQDHQVISQEGFRAFKNTSILGYEVPWNNLTFKTDAFVVLNDYYISKKVKALLCYKSQMDKFYMSEEFAKSLAIARGIQINNNYAEAFEVIRWIIK